MVVRKRNVNRHPVQFKNSFWTKPQNLIQNNNNANSLFVMQIPYLSISLSLSYSYSSSVSVRFGVIAMLAGIIGVPLGTYLTQKLRKKSHRYDPIICACGILISAPLLVGAMLLVNVNEPLAYTVLFVGEVALNLNWAIVADILLVRFQFIHKFFQTHTHTLSKSRYHRRQSKTSILFRQTESKIDFICLCVCVFLWRCVCVCFVSFTCLSLMIFVLYGK